jgi:DNA-binding MarR family transcriptional regulator
MKPMDEDLQRTVASFRRLVTSINRAKTHERLTEAAGVRLDKPGVEIIVHLLDVGEPRRIGMIADALRVESPHVTRHVAALEKVGLVERVRDPDDGRAWRIALTEEGILAAGRCRRVTTEWFEGALTSWDDPDKAELARLLGKLSDDLCVYLRDQVDRTSSAR